MTHLLSVHFSVHPIIWANSLSTLTEEQDRDPLSSMFSHLKGFEECIYVIVLMKWTWLPHLQLIHFKWGVFFNLWLVTPWEYIVLYQHCYSEAHFTAVWTANDWFPSILSLRWNSSGKVKLTTQRAWIIKVQIKQTMRPLKRLWDVVGEVLTRPEFMGPSWLMSVLTSF